MEFLQMRSTAYVSVLVLVLMFIVLSALPAQALEVTWTPVPTDAVQVDHFQRLADEPLGVPIGGRCTSSLQGWQCKTEWSSPAVVVCMTTECEKNTERDTNFARQ